MTDVPEGLRASLADRYRIEREIGRGGMATVYLARDVRHDRLVAIKVLSPELGAVLAVERFLAEIKVTANLQHPNLLPLFDSGEAAGNLFYVMPYVEGETLRARLDREKQLPVDEAVRIAVATAKALEYAHGQGVIHRDLKPSNILLQAGLPMVADFGIALAVSGAAGPRMTQTGVSLGTPQYMSPEQATGERAVDARTDQYSLAATTYEMLAGEPPHTGATAQVVMRRMLTEEPRAIRVVRPSVAEHVEQALARALAKVPADRFATIGEFSAALQGDGTVATTPAPRSVMRTHRLPLIVAAAAAAAIALTAVAYWWPAATTRTPLAFSGDAQFVSRGGVAVALSPDGEQVVYSAGADGPRLYLKKRGDASPTKLIGSDGAFSPLFSPDGKWIAFLADNKLQKIPVSGGLPITLADSVARFSWGDSDVVVVTRPNGVMALVRPNGGRSESIAAPDASQGQRLFSWPHVLPGGNAVLFNVALGSTPDSFVVAALRLADRAIVPLELHCLNPRYVSAGYLLCARTDGTVIAAPFDAKQLRIMGAAEVVLDSVEVRGQGAAYFAVSNNGTLVYALKSSASQLVSIDRAGRASVLLPDERNVWTPRVSPDGNRLAFGTLRGPSSVDIWTYDFGTHVRTRITTDGQSRFPNWSPDGRSIIWYRSGRPSGGVWRRPWDGSEPESALLNSARGTVVSRAGNFVLIYPPGSVGDSVLESIALDSRRRTKVRPPSKAHWSHLAVSVDGRWLAYQAVVSGLPEVFIEPIPATGASHQVSVHGGAEPVWAPSGRELFYLVGGSLWSATLAGSPKLAVIRRDSLFAFRPAPGGEMQSYDVMPDGKTFIAARFIVGSMPPVLVTGWFAELRARMAHAKGK